MTQDPDNAYIAEALPAFISEAQEQIERIEQLLLELDEQPDDAERLNELFRCAHTVKGSAGIFGLDDIVAFTHHVETLLSRVREGEIRLTPELATLLLRSGDQMSALIGEATGKAADPANEALRRQLVDQLQAASGAAPGADEPAATASTPACAAAGDDRADWRIAIAFNPDSLRNGMDPLPLLKYLQGMGELREMRCDHAAVPQLDALEPTNCHLSFNFVLRTDAPLDRIESAFSFVREDCALTLEPVAPVAPVATATPAAVAAPAAAPAPAPAPDAAPRKTPRADGAKDANGEDQRFIRVQAARLDSVINLLGELVIAGAGAALLARVAKQPKLLEANAQINRLIEEIRNSTLQLRMVPIGETFTRFRRVVRDTAAELGKDVALELQGGDTELDKSVVERIADPLMHLVRNALDHGLETPDQRSAAGKPAQGKLTLSACHESGSILIRIVDDGRGIQRTKVLQRAWDRGLVERGVTPDDEAILRLIFEPGFSTAEKVTNLSGRGVGMDVVRSNIEALRGSVLLSSTEGQGSCIEIRLPLTLAIIDGFLVGVGSSKFIFPLDAVVEVIEDRTQAAELDARGRGVVELRGQVLPVVSLTALYALEPGEPGRGSVVVLRAGNRRFGVLVDTLLGQHQTVIKPLGRMFRSLRGMSGSSILGNGEVALIFDVNSLCQLASEPAAATRHRNRSADPSHRIATEGHAS